jgi:hypothetical protein
VLGLAPGVVVKPGPVVVLRVGVDGRRRQTQRVRERLVVPRQEQHLVGFAAQEGGGGRVEPVLAVEELHDVGGAVTDRHVVAHGQLLQVLDQATLQAHTAHGEVGL